MSAYDLNRSRRLEKALVRLAEQAALPPEQRHTTGRALVRVEAPGLVPQYGFFLATGVILRGMRHFRDFVGSHGLRGELAGGISVLRGFAGVAKGSGGWADTPGATVTLAGAARDRVWPDQILLVATTLERLLLGFRPWWGAGGGALRVTGLARAPRSLLRLAPALLRGRDHPRLTAANGYRSTTTDGLGLAGASGFALDGEVFALAADAAVTATPPVDFVAL